MCREPGLKQCPPLSGTNMPQENPPSFYCHYFTHRHSHNEASGGLFLCRRLLCMAIVSASVHVLEKETERRLISCRWLELSALSY